MDGFVQDPVTGVVESPYVVNGITYTQDQVTGNFAGLLFTAEDSTNLYFAFVQSVLINDNTYGDNAIGWGFRRKGHSLKDLLNSEHIEVRIFDGGATPALDFFLDYATRNKKTRVVENLGATGGDGEIIIGSAADITGSASSLTWNFNIAAPTFGNKDNTNPSRVPTNAYGPGTTADPNLPWIYEIVYEWSVAKSALSGGTVTDLQILEVHNSPVKTGNPVPVPVITVQKVADPPSGSDVARGQTIKYTISATNSGSSALTDVVITDVIDVNLSSIAPLDGGTFDSLTRTITWPTIPLFSPGDTATVQFTAVADPVKAVPPEGTDIFDFATINSPDLPTPVNTNTTVHSVPEDVIPGNPELSLVKTATPTTYSAVGDVISYSYLVTNSGNVSVSQPITIDDDVATDEVCPALPASLAPLDTITCTASHTITQADLDSGSVTNSATASGLDPNGATVTSPPDDETVNAVQNPALSLVKTATPTTYSGVGDVISYSYLVTNSGNVSVSQPITIDDDVATDEVCPALPASLAPLDTITCTASHTITQADLDSGSVTNSATASGLDPNGATVTSPPDDETVNAVQNPALSLVKTATPTTYSAVGDVISYSYLVTNSGNVSVSQPITIDDDVATDEVCPALPASLAPLDTITCTASHTITQADLDSGSVTNSATASGLDPNGATVTSPPDDETVNAVQNPALSLVKTLLSNADEDASGTVTFNDTLTYHFVATNTGNQTLTGVTITDPLTGLSALSCTPAQPTTLAPTAAMTCTANYTVTQVDVGAGVILNTATADSVESPPVTDDETVTVPLGVCLVIIDEETIDNAISTILAAAAAHGVTGDFLTNDDSPTEVGNPPLRWNVNFAGDIVKLPGGQRDDEGLFALPETIRYADDRTLADFGLTTSAEWIAAFVAGTLPQAALDKVRDVMPLRNQDLAALVGRTCVGVVYDSNISINFQPLNASLMGGRYGLFTFTVLAVEVPGSTPESQSSTSLYDLWVQVEEPLGGGAPLQINLVDHPPDTVQITTAKQKANGKLFIFADSDFAPTAITTVSIDGSDAGADPNVDPFALEANMPFRPAKQRYEFVEMVAVDLTGRRVSVQTNEGGNYSVSITASALNGGGGGLTTESPGPNRQARLDVTIVSNVIRVWVDDAIGDPAKLARIRDAIAEMNEGLDRNNLDITMTVVTEEGQADIKVLFEGTDAGVIASADGGELGSTITMSNNVEFSWYTGTDTELIQSVEYDWQTVVLHELGHAIGMDHSNNPGSAMYFFLETGETRRELHQTDLSELQVGIN